MAKVELVSRERNIAHMVVHLDAEAVDKQYKALFREYAKDLNIPGFRKGKVPPNVLRSRIGEDSLNSAAAEMLKELAVDEGLAELKLTPRHGAVTWHSDPEPREGQAVSYEVSVPVLPDVTLPDYRNYELAIPVLQVTDEMKRRYRERLAEKYTEYPEKDGAAGEGEALLISFASKFIETEEPSPLQHEGLLYVIGREGNMPGWDERLLGAAAGEHRTFTYLVPENFADQRVAKKSLVLDFDIKSIHSVIVPEVDEAFVKDTLHMESLAQFEEYLQISLERERDAQADQLKREQAIQRVATELEADITEDMVSDELDGMVKDNDRQLRQYQSSLDQYLKEKGQTLAEYRESLQEAAQRKIRFFLAVKTIADHEGLVATGEDFERYAIYLMQQEGIPAEQMRELMKHREFYTEAAYQIVRDKVLAHLAQSVKAQAEELAPEAPAEPSAS
jgi:trigger factor